MIPPAPLVERPTDYIETTRSTIRRRLVAIGLAGFVLGFLVAYALAAGGAA